VDDAESTVQRLAEVQLAQTVTETRDSVRRQVTDELQGQFTLTLKETTDQLRTEWNTERARLADQLEEWRIFADTQRQLAEANSQTEILMRFLKLAERFAPAIAVYVSKPDGLALWKARGQAAFPKIVSQGTIDPEWFFHQIIVRDKLIAAVCAAQPYKLEAINFLVACLDRSIETFGMKLRTPPPVPKQSAPEPTPAEAAAAEADEKSHADAKQIARLLISEIKLYHEDEVKAGRANADLYSRLQADIEGAREQYRQRVSTARLGNTDYFHEELVRILTDNDESRLGADYPGSTK
jgi:hypothetical protein